MTVKEFNELVWNYGASGSKVLEGLTDKEKEAVVNTWNDVEFELNNDTEEEKIDSMINSYYKDTKYRISFSYYNLNGDYLGGGLISEDGKSLTNCDGEILFDTEEDAKEWINQNKNFWNRNGSFEIF